MPLLIIIHCSLECVSYTLVTWRYIALCVWVCLPACTMRQSSKHLLINKHCVRHPLPCTSPSYLKVCQYHVWNVGLHVHMYIHTVCIYCDIRMYIYWTSGMAWRILCLSNIMYIIRQGLIELYVQHRYVHVHQLCCIGIFVWSKQPPSSLCPHPHYLRPSSDLTPQVRVGPCNLWPISRTSSPRATSCSMDSQGET